MGLVFGAIAPHGGLAVAEACTPEEMQLAHATRSGMEELGREFTAAKPEVVVVATPHNVHIPGAFAVLVAARMSGNLDGTPQPVELEVPIETGCLVAPRNTDRSRPARGWSQLRLERPIDGPGADGLGSPDSAVVHGRAE